jgi:hypothetical protein
MLKIYGVSDNIVVFEGQVKDEFDVFDVGLKVTFADGTVAIISYGKNDLAIWKIEVLSKGDKFDRLEECFDEDDEIYSDVLYMKDNCNCFINEIEEV